MKHSAIAFLLALLPMVAEAYDVKIDGIYYNLVRKANIAEVVAGDEPYEGDVNIPSTFTYDGVDYAVTAISGGIFRMTNITSITLSDEFKEIG